MYDRRPVEAHTLSMEQIFLLVYDELRRMAARKLRDERTVTRSARRLSSTKRGSS